MLTNGSGNGRAPGLNRGAYSRATINGGAEEDTRTEGAKLVTANQPFARLLLGINSMDRFVLSLEEIGSS